MFTINKLNIDLFVIHTGYNYELSLQCMIKVCTSFMNINMIFMTNEIKTKTSLFHKKIFWLLSQIVVQWPLGFALQHSSMKVVS